MIRIVLPLLLVLASVTAMAKPPRFLGPPVKKPADAGQPSQSGSADAGTADAGTDAGTKHQPDPRRPKDTDGKKLPKEDR